MTDTKFTPGPWKAVLQFGEWFVRHDPAESEWNGLGYQHICALPAAKKNTHYGEMFRANATLIAAAPQMYETLQFAEEEIMAGIESRSELLYRIRAALAAAEGRMP